ncbi:MAG: SDR family oxidoreductase [Lentisphaeria bacterium]|nr:SDR family oxidoreductase [Lentisphaeria bacterium]
MIKALKQFIRDHLFIKKIIPLEIPVYTGKLLTDKIALIIGGSGGIGFAIAKAFVASGAKVVITGTHQEKLVAMCNELGDGCARYVVSDVTKVAEIDEMVKCAVGKFGKIDILVYSAGVHCKEPFGRISESTWDNVLDVNLKGMYFTCQSIADYMIKNNIKGHILTISSASSAKPGWTPYEISKHGAKALTLGFADKLIQYGIVVNGIAPGPVATNMLNRGGMDDVYWPGNPTGRMSTPSEMANWAVFLVSDIGNMVVGDTFYISGGSGTICLDK